MIRPRVISEEEFAAMVQKVGRGVLVGTSTQRSGGLPAVNGQTMASCGGERKQRSVGTNAAGSNPAPSLSSPYRSKLEAAWANYLHGLWMLKVITHYWYEPFSIWLPGKVRFKPDFLVQTTNGLTIYEVKGYSPNRRDGITRLKMAAALFPCFTWVLVTREKGVWNETPVGQ